MPRVEITAAGPAEYPAACRALFAHRLAPDRDKLAVRALGLIASGEIDPSGLLVARIGDRTVGAALSQTNPGNAAVVWPPRAESEAVRLALAQGVIRRLRSAGVKLAQAHCDPSDNPDPGPLLAVGFRCVCQVELLCRPVDATHDTTAFLPAESPVTFKITDATDTAFGELILTTYEGTLDCPELNGTRTASEVLAGYASLNRPVWRRVVRAGVPVGVLILNSDKAGIMDLTYLGLVPAARGRGWGAALLRYALSYAAESLVEWVNLSVDARNTPALRLYRAWSFRRHNTQDVYLWQPPA